MKKFIGRNSEIKVLEKEYERESGFVVVYGRRRVGKTTLIKEFIKNKKALYFLATEEMEKGNMNRFADVLAEHTNQPFLKNANFTDWESLFKVFASYKPEEKKIIVIDEFQYLVNVNSAFPSIFQRIWDEVLKEHNVMVILCGSLISRMLTHVLSYSSPLYGRRTAQIRLSPLKFVDLLKNQLQKEVQNPKELQSFEELVETYAITGGVPKYFEFFDNRKGLMENIKEEILSTNGFLYEEPIFLLEKEVRELVSYFTIIKSLAAGNHKVSQLAGDLQLSSSTLSPYLKTLMDLDLVEKRVPITEKQPEKSRKGLYFIKDHFIEFWFRFVYAYKGELELENRAYVVEKLNKNFIDNHVSFVFEDISRDVLAMLCKDGEIPFTPSKIGAYWSSNIEIDVAAIDEEHKEMILGECKYRKMPIDQDVYFQLKEKALKMVDGKEYLKRFVIFSKSGFTDRLLEIAKQDDRLVLVDKAEVVKKEFIEMENC